MSLITISDLYVKKLSFYSQFCIVVVPTPQHGMVVSTPLDHHRTSQLKNKARWSSESRWSSGVETIREH